MTKAEEVVESLDTQCRYRAAALPECAAHDRATWIPGTRRYVCETTGLVFQGPADSANAKLSVYADKLERDHDDTKS